MVIFQQLNPSADLLFDNEYQDSGIYQPEVTQPDYANAQNSSIWGLHLLRVKLKFFTVLIICIINYEII